jgi:hypothetical protein
MAKQGLAQLGKVQCLASIKRRRFAGMPNPRNLRLSILPTQNSDEPHGALENDRVVLFPGQRLAMSTRCARVVNNLDRGIRRQAEDRNPAAAPINDVASKAGIVLLF